MHVLVIEDDEDVSLLYRLALERAGHTVAVAVDGTSIVDLGTALAADVIVLDGMLPDIDGLDVLAHLAESEETRRIPVVMASARVGTKDRILALEAGASAYLSKPFEASTIVGVVEDVARQDPLVRDDIRRRLISALSGGDVAGGAPPRRTGRDRPSTKAPTVSNTLSQVLNLAFDAIVSVDEDQLIVGFNKGAEAIFGYLAEEVIGKPLDILIPARLVGLHAQHLERFATERDSGRLMGEQRNVRGRRRDGTEFPAEASITKLELDGRPVLTAILRDATERRRTESELRNRAQQQAAVAELGQRAVTASNVHVLLDDAVTMLAQVLGADLTKVMELEPDGQHLRMAAGAGWRPGLVGTYRTTAGRDSPASFTLELGAPIVFDDLQHDARFQRIELLAEHGVVSGMSVALHGRTRPLGTIGVYTRAPRQFTTDDIHVLQAIANVVASAIQREKDESRIRAFLDAAPDATLVVDREGKVVSANASAEQLFGYTRDELLRIGVDALVPSAARAGHGAHRARYAEERRSRAMGEGLELAALRKDGTEVPVDIMLRPLETDEGPLVVAAVRDVTDRRRNEAVRDAFLHAVSHELRTPLTSVLGFSSLLVEHHGSGLSPEALDLAERIRSNAGKLERLLSDLLDLDRLARGVLEAQRRAVPIRDALQHALDSIATGERQISSAIEPPDLVAEVDPAQFERIVENLVVNAVRHTPPEATVSITVSRSHNGILVIVEDDGPGVPAELREQIFEPFRRNPGPTAAPGTGIGLSLVARFAELHRGRAWVEEREGGGASFRVVLASP